MKILNFGSCNLDYVYSLPYIVRKGETLSADKMEIFPGGKGLNQSIAAARAGAEIYHAGYIGADGGILLDILAESNVDVSYLKRADMKNGHAIIQVDKSGANSIFIYKGTNGIISREFIDETLNDFSAGDILLLQNEINNVSYLTEKAYKKGMKIILNPSPFDEDMKKIDLKMITWLILNEIEVKGFSGTDNAEDTVAYMRTHYPDLKLMLTLGENGCIYADGSNLLSHPAFDVNVIDTTAAGDTFTGYFIAMVASGKPYSEIIRYASAAAAIAVSRKGAAPSIPYMSEVDKFLENI